MAFFPAPGYQPVYKPSLPYRCPVYGGLRPGMSIYIQGIVNHHVSHFVVNFSCGQYDGTDIAFHFNPRFDGKDKVVFNSFLEGNWGAEEKRKDHFPFHKGKHFEMVVFVNPGSFQVNVNGQPYYEYPHRIPVERVDTIHVDGDLTIESLNVIGGGGGGMGGVMPMPSYPSGNLPVMGGPLYNPPVPYYGNIMGGLSSKRTVVVRGFIPEGAEGFTLNFKVGSSDDIVLHFNPRLTEDAVVRNSLLGGSWGSEERGLNFNPFRPGQYFDISIRCGNSRFKIYVNGEHFCDFAHRFQAFQMVDTLEVKGDVILSFVQI
ncbi:galectin-4 [Bombina bombina]|uniref:galectin-4 n=1 Tax=Bombina bombina TaxID=8345 RepID=UPI00235A572B|nr:galectin-4 [Bombina bombina]